MALATISARVDAYDKADFDKFCSNIGINTSTAINMFIKSVLRERRIPFGLYTTEKDNDPFYGKENIDYVLKSVNELRAGLGKPHELIEV